MNQLAQIIQNNNNNTNNGNENPIRAEYIFDFAPLDSPDDTSYYLFTERIVDMVAQYGEGKVLLSLVACLKNTRAKNRYTSLSDTDKTRLRTSIQDWKDLLKRDFGIKPLRETFSFSQGTTIVFEVSHTHETWTQLINDARSKAFSPNTTIQVYVGLKVYTNHMRAVWGKRGIRGHGMKVMRVTHKVRIDRLKYWLEVPDSGIS